MGCFIASCLDPPPTPPTHTIPPLLGSKIQSVIWEYVALPHSLQYEFYLKWGLLSSLLHLLFCLLSSSVCLCVWWYMCVHTYVFVCVYVCVWGSEVNVRCLPVSLHSPLLTHSARLAGSEPRAAPVPTLPFSRLWLPCSAFMWVWEI